MAVLRAILILAAVVALASLPCLVLVLTRHDVASRHGVAAKVPAALRRLAAAVPAALRRLPAAGRRAAGLIRHRHRRIKDPNLSRRERRRLTRLDRCFAPHAVPQDDPTRPPIEKVAADLRRLRRQRTGIALRSPVWFAAIEKAYDDRLRLACERLGITGHLDELTGVDRDIERVRLEGEVEAAGLSLHGYEAAAS